MNKCEYDMNQTVLSIWLKLNMHVKGNRLIQYANCDNCPTRSFIFRINKIFLNKKSL